MIQETPALTTAFETQANLLKVLTHPARIAILEILRDGEHCVCHMEAYLGFRQAYISQQLAVLREAGLIADRRDGWNIFYRVSDTRIFTVLDAAKAITGELPTSPEKEVICTCPHCQPGK
jgi:DNA-binding transcriptional ArsR family regulator